MPVQVFGAVDLNSDVLTTPHSGGFGIALWEKVGARDPVPGYPQAGDQPDYVVSLTNDLTGNRYTTLSFAYAFTKDLSGQPIQNQDPREGNGAARAVRDAARATCDGRIRRSRHDYDAGPLRRPVVGRASSAADEPTADTRNGPGSKLLASRM